jgi:acyl-CoA thioesterase-2
MGYHVAFEVESFADLMHLEQHGVDTYVGRGPEYPWGRVYGGQVVAQGLRAASLTVEPQLSLHSVHAYFIRGGDSDEPIRFEVDRIRNGRSFATRRVVARQSGGAILNLAASYQVTEDGATYQAESLSPSRPLPETIEPDPTTWGPLFERRWITHDRERGESAAWLRLIDCPDDPVMNQCGLAYLSDDLPTDGVLATHPQSKGGLERYDGLIGASLDHAIWFHRPMSANRWQLYDFRGSGVENNRGLAIGRVFDEAGVHVATVAQEVLMRKFDRQRAG